MSSRQEPIEAANTTSEEQHRISFEAFGVSVSVEVPYAELLPRVMSVFPPGWQPCESVPEDHEFRLASRDGVSYRVQSSSGRSVAGSSDLDVAIAVLDSELRAFIAFKAPDHIFVHAGVVASDGRGIVLPGPTFSGKTTLVAELVRAGATYYSDEFAVLDSAGQVHPYPKPLSLRLSGFSQIDHDVSTLGGVVGVDPSPVGMIIMSRYVPGARWDPQRISRGEAVLAVLANTVPAQERPEQSMTAIRNAVADAVVLEGERGEAAEVVEQVLESLPA